jgi:hypothetical protein
VHPHHGLPQRPYRTIGDVEFATAGWVDWYNRIGAAENLGRFTLLLP